ncbi:hypothetical protein SDC9_192612 [bioreactor metagenome]|uniref:Uncharacterized protein n=1 Tax=bioreactor metagenome TaxID=1076179 RepID=A0A645I194_9ZZZZ
MPPRVVDRGSNIASPDDRPVPGNPIPPDPPEQKLQRWQPAISFFQTTMRRKPTGAVLIERL